MVIVEICEKKIKKNQSSKTREISHLEDYWKNFVSFLLDQAIYILQLIIPKISQDQKDTTVKT